MRPATGFDADAYRGQLRDTGPQVMAGQALAIHDVAPVIHSHCVQHALGDIDPEDVHLWLHGTRLLWLNGFTALKLIVAHCRRSAQGRVHFITTFGITRYFTDGWGAYERYLEAEQHTVGKAHTQKIESKHINMRTRIKRLVRRTICFSKTERMHDLVIGLFINRYEFGVSV
jgi:IS1 family transposase